MRVELLEHATFRKADGSGDVGCVAVASAPGVVGVRDWKEQNGPVLAFASSEWGVFIQSIKCGELDMRR